MVDEGDGISALSNTNYTIIIENKMESTNYLYSLFIPCIVHQFSLDFCSIVMTQIKWDYLYENYDPKYYDEMKNDWRLVIEAVDFCLLLVSIIIMTTNFMLNWYGNSEWFC